MENLILKTGREEIDTLVSDTISSVINGNTDPLFIAVQIKKFERAFDKIKSQISDYITDEAVKYAGDVVYGARIETSMQGVKYNYCDCGSTEWKEVDDQINFLNKKKKIIEQSLKNISNATPSFDPKTGEILHPPLKTGKEGVKITIQ
jgi:hypothetical protein